MACLCTEGCNANQSRSKQSIVPMNPAGPLFGQVNSASNELFPQPHPPSLMAAHGARTAWRRLGQVTNPYTNNNNYYYWITHPLAG